MIWFLLRCFWSSIIIFKQLDVKVIVAYSSVLHISFCCLCIFLLNFYGIFSRIFIRLIHRILSPLIFYWSYEVYSIFNTRINFSNLRFLSFSNKFLIIFILIFNLRFPLFRCFFAEIFRFLNIVFSLNFYLNIFRFLTFLVSIIFTFNLIFIVRIFLSKSIFKFLNFYTFLYLSFWMIFNIFLYIFLYNF